MDEPAKLGQPSLLGRYETLLGQEPTHEQFPVKKMGKLRTGLGLAMAALAGPNSAGPLADMVLHGREREAEKRFEQAHQEWEGRLGRVEKEARLGEVSARTREAEARARQLEAKPDSPSDKKIDEYVNDQGQRTLIFQRPNGETYEKAFGKTQPKPAGHTNPFEAFAYGDANERKAAQDFIAFEKRMGSQYQRPGEVEQRYQLYKLDPDAYKQMFGKEGGDRAHASRMLTYFQRQRDSVSKDFMLDEATKAQRLREIEELERPFLETAGVGAGQNGQKFKPGQTVYDKQGNPRKIKRVLPGGKLELE